AFTSAPLTSVVKIAPERLARAATPVAKSTAIVILHSTTYLRISILRTLLVFSLVDLGDSATQAPSQSRATYGPIPKRVSFSLKPFSSSHPRRTATPASLRFSEKCTLWPRQFSGTARTFTAERRKPISRPEEKGRLARQALPRSVNVARVFSPSEAF